LKFPPAHFRLADLAILFGVIALPLIGTAVAGREVDEILQFPPPLDIPSEYVRFSWAAVAGVVGALIVILVSWITGAWPASVREGSRSELASRGFNRRFPIWGWCALVWTMAWWVLAWTRWAWFEDLQHYTFFPLWLGFIVTVNGLTERRAGTCMMRRAPRIWLALFVTSALFWWLFEWLNRFVRNWHYLAVEDFGAAAYALHASLCFSTVLPAVAAMAEWLGSHPGWMAGTAAGPAWPWLQKRGSAVALVVAGASALVLTGVYPEYLYPALWIAPLALCLGEPVLTGRGDLPREIARGDWRRAATWMIAALACGLFWELWNWHSLAKWIYTVPGVERWHLFEMPLLGYAGYLPFGLECLLVAERVAQNAWIAPLQPAGTGSATRGIAR
jgi:hypothetical protein